MVALRARGLRTLILIITLASAPGLPFASQFKIRKSRASDNPRTYLSFSQRLTQDEEIHHAFNRLTFGPRPGSLESFRRDELGKWLNAQLHPETIPENPLLEQRLLPFESIRLSARDTYLRYPSPRTIVSYARGINKLPDDPELRAVIVELAHRYYKRRHTSIPTALAGNEDTEDPSDLEARTKVSDLLTAAQIETLQHGRADEKRQVLGLIPPARGIDFALSISTTQRKQLMNFAPVTLRRQMMLAVDPQRVVADDLAEAKLLRAIYSNHQLAELLDDFWFNHFNVFVNKGADRYLVPTFEREAIRPNVLGKFYDLLLATAKSPAMLFYLDNWRSVATPTNAPVPNNGKTQHGLNENYGRELLELHTLGVNGGYTQKDVVEVARCFTGWTIAKPQKGGSFEYNDKLHDKDQKVVLGHVIAAGGGMNDGLQVLDILAHHPSTAHFISLKLAQRFVADDPPPSLVNRMTESFRKTDGNLREVVRVMLSSGEFWSKGAYQAKIKTPLEMVASSVRVAEGDTAAVYGLTNELGKLGEPLYRKIEPTGYSSANAEWVSSASLLERMNFALALTNNRVPGTKVDIAHWSVSQSDPFVLARRLLGTDPSAQTCAAIRKMLESPAVREQLASDATKRFAPVSALVAGLTLGSPEFQRR